MKQMVIQGVVLVLMLSALPLTSLGTTTGATWASVVGLALIGVGALGPPVLRYAGPKGDDEDDDAAQDEGAPR